MWWRQWRPLYGLKMGLGSVAAIQRRVSAALAQPTEAAHQYVQWQSAHHEDETGWRESKQQLWLWVHATKAVTVFRLLRGRSKAQAQEVIGQSFKGVVSTDRYNAYYWVDPRRRQICWAHLKRDFQAMSERQGESAEIGLNLLLKPKNSSASRVNCAREN